MGWFKGLPPKTCMGRAWKSSECDCALLTTTATTTKQADKRPPAINKCVRLGGTLRVLPSTTWQEPYALVILQTAGESRTTLKSLTAFLIHPQRREKIVPE
mmetsp:Transcript_50315/g.102531  ORF Transcript_50315/g.102531 Transcript_50315/m.102531 type:complete len:101 (+) Transcript_50315:643-945(+)